MHSFLSFNHQIHSAANVNLPAISSATLYGKGVFTTVAVYRAKPFLWERHWHRLSENALRISIDLSGFNQEEVTESLYQIIEKNNITAARVRLTFFDTSSGLMWPTDPKNKTSLLIQTAGLRSVPNRLQITVSPFPVNSGSPLTGVKSCNYLENLLALEKAKAGGFDEAVRLNERGEITSGCLANIFWVKNGRLFTPDLETGCLAGVMRGFIIERAGQINLQTFTVKEDLAGLLEADEIFLTSSGIGIASVGKIDEKEFANNISKNLREIFLSASGSSDQKTSGLF